MLARGYLQKKLLNDKIDGDFWDLLLRLLDYDANARLPARKALEHPYFMRKIPLLLYRNL